MGEGRKMRIGLYPGSFDPITNGHIDIINRGAKMFDKLIISVSINSAKKYMFEVGDRVSMINEVFKNRPEIEVIASECLTIDTCKAYGATHILRGLRAVTDYEFEFQMTNFNRQISNEIDTVFLMTDVKWAYLSSSAVRELARFGGDISKFVPECVKQMFEMKT